jgi:hypothetical protein
VIAATYARKSTRHTTWRGSVSEPSRPRSEGWWALNCGLFTVPLLAAALAVALFCVFRSLGLVRAGDLVSRLSDNTKENRNGTGHDTTDS